MDYDRLAKLAKEQLADQRTVSLWMLILD